MKSIAPSNITSASDERRNGQGRRGNGQLDHTVDDSATQNDHEPAADVLPVNASTTTKAGKQRQRMAWTDEMNKDVMRCYFTASKLETIKSGFRAHLRQLFLEKYPYLSNITEQRLMDQKRVIVCNNRLSPNQIQQIKEEITIALQETDEVRSPIRNPQNTPLQSPTNNPNTSIYQTQPDNPPEQHHINSSTQEDFIEKKLLEEITHWQTVDPKKRPRLPKLKINNETSNTLQQLNKIITSLITNKPIATIEEIHMLVYSAAYITLTQNKQKIVQNKHRNPPKLPKWQIRLERKIETLRKNIGRLTQYKNGNRTNKLMKKYYISYKTTQPR